MVKQVYATGDLADAYAVRRRLWAVGIQAIIRGQDLSAMRDLQMRKDSPLSVWVDDADAEQAGQIVGNRPGS